MQNTYITSIGDKEIINMGILGHLPDKVKSYHLINSYREKTAEEIASGRYSISGSATDIYFQNLRQSNKTDQYLENYIVNSAKEAGVPDTIFKDVSTPALEKSVDKVVIDPKIAEVEKSVSIEKLAVEKKVPAKPAEEKLSYREFKEKIGERMDSDEKRKFIRKFKSEYSGYSRRYETEMERKGGPQK